MPAQLALDVAAVLGVGQPAQPHPHQFGDAVLGVEHRAAPCLGGMRGDDRGDQRTVERLGHLLGVEVGVVELEVRRGQGAVLRRFPGSLVDGAAAFAVDVLGDVGQQREMGERADHRDRVAGIDAVEQSRELRTVDLGAAHPERLDPRLLDESERLVAVLLAHGVAEDRTEQPDVLPHRLGRLPPHLRALDGSDGFEQAVGCRRHGAQYRRSHRGTHGEHGSVAG